MSPALARTLRGNGLGLVLIGLFLVFLAGQAAAGYGVYADELQASGQAPVGPLGYLSSGHFIEATFENWESEFLQMGALVLLSAVLYQRGSPESKDPDSEEAVDREPDASRPGAPWPIRAGGTVRRLYEHSLTLALLAMFAISFVLHALGGTSEHNREQRAQGQPEVTTLQFIASGEFWFQSFQNWQSEFLSAGALVVLTIFLRQRGSAASKPVDEPHATTGSF